MAAEPPPVAVTLGIAETRRRFCGLIAEVTRTGDPAIVTNNRVRIAAIVPIAAIDATPGDHD